MQPSFTPRVFPYDKHYVGLPHNDTGTWLQLTMGSSKIVIAPKKKKMPVGTYSVRIRAGVSDQVPAFRHFLELGYESERNLGRGQLRASP